MKKVFIFSNVIAAAMLFCLVPYCVAQQDFPPPLTQQPVAAPPAPGPPPGQLREATPPPPPPVPAPPGPGGAQNMPPQSLLNNLSAAVVTAQRVRGHLSPGKVWTVQGPAGETEIKAGILYQGRVVAVLHFSPIEGSVLPVGMPSRDYQNISHAQPLIQRIKTQLPAIFSQLKILPCAEFREPEASWAFPVALGSRIVAHLKVYYDGIHIVPDYPANQEMQYYGQ